jgi:hypothetical protein
LNNKTQITNMRISLTRRRILAVTEVGRQRGERLQTLLDEMELAAIDDFRFEKHMPSRAAAVRELLKRGLTAEGFLTAGIGAKSNEFGATGKTPVKR